jgi:hypothetical protein
MTNATEAFRRARKSGFEWLVHIDSDELLYAEKPLPCLFADAPEVDVLVFPTKEAVPQQFEYNHPFRQISLFKYNPLGYLLQENSHGGYFDREWRKFAVRVWQYKNRLVKKIGYDHPTFLDSLLLGHTNGKAATRTSSPVVKIGNHRPQAMTNHTLNVHSLRQGGLLHFDCMGYEQWCKKWIARLDGTANFDTDRFRPDRKQVLKMFGSARVGGEKDIRSLYERMYFLSPSEKIVLKSLGFIERICLSERFFEKASESPSSERTG